MKVEELNKIIRLFQGLYIDTPIHIGSDLLSPELGGLWRWHGGDLRMAGFLFIEDEINKGLFHIPNSSLLGKGLTPEQLVLILDTFESGVEVLKK